MNCLEDDLLCYLIQLERKQLSGYNLPQNCMSYRFPLFVHNGF